MPRLGPPVVTPALRADWCERLLGSAPATVLFEAGHLASVVGVELRDGRRVVVRARPPAERLAACALVHAHMWRAGYPCPEPLVGPVILDRLAVSIEACVRATEPIPRPQMPGRCARALARLVALAPARDSLPTLAPCPAWVAWDHEQGSLWPPADDRDDDLNAVREPAWIDAAGLRAQRRLSASDLPPVVGHADWWAHNLLWRNGMLRAVVDWDSAAALPEAALVGVAAAIFPPTPPSVQESRAFLAAYQHARGSPVSQEELEVSWAAGSWTRAFDAKKESVDGAGPVQSALSQEIDERLRLARA